MAKAAIRLPIEGQKRRKLLVLIAAYIDAGEPRPTIEALATRLGFEDQQLVFLLKALERDGWLRRRRRSRTGRRKAAAKGGKYMLFFDEQGNRQDPTQAAKT